MLKTIKQYHDNDVEGIRCTGYVIALGKQEKKIIQRENVASDGTFE